MNRKNGLGGSDMAAVMGVSRFRSPLQVFFEKTGILPAHEGNRFTHWGNRLEDVIAEEFTYVTGKRVRRNNRELIHPSYEFLRGNIDREVVGENAVLEVKTASAYKSDEWAPGMAPIEYVIQLQHYLMLTGADLGYFAVLIGGNDFRWFVVERDAGLIQDIEESGVAFWNRHVIPGTPPEPNELDSGVLLHLHPNAATSELVELGDDYEVLFREYIDAREAEKTAATRKEAMGAKLKSLIGDASGAVAGGYSAKWTRFQRATLDTVGIKTFHPDIASKFTKLSPSGQLAVSERRACI